VGRNVAIESLFADGQIDRVPALASDLVRRNVNVFVATGGTGSVVKRPVVMSVDGADAIAIRHMMYLYLSYDHRWIDGHKAAQFNGLLKKLLEEGDFAGELGLQS